MPKSYFSVAQDKEIYHFIFPVSSLKRQGDREIVYMKRRVECIKLYNSAIFALKNRESDLMA